jgi:hypothetical protein
MNKLFLLLAAFMFIGTMVNGQIRQAKPLNPEVKSSTSAPSDGQSGTREMTPKFTETSTPISNSDIENKTILQELNTLDDQRFSIESDQSLSDSERALKIQGLNANYFEVKQRFYDYVSNKGILNVSKSEQSFYLSMLKADGKTQEYQDGINLIKNSK